MKLKNNGWVKLDNKRYINYLSDDYLLYVNLRLHLAGYFSFASLSATYTRSPGNPDYGTISKQLNEHISKYWIDIDHPYDGYEDSDFKKEASQIIDEFIKYQLYI